MTIVGEKESLKLSNADERRIMKRTKNREERKYKIRFRGR